MDVALPALVVAASYEIQPGDTLTSIANRFETTVQAFVDANDISNPNLIVAGDTLRIPEPVRNAQDGAAVAQPATPQRPGVRTNADGVPYTTGGTGAVGASRPAPASTPRTPAADSSSPSMTREQYYNQFEEEVMRLINDIRRSYGLQELSYSAQLDRAARGHVHHMARVNRMAHEGIGDGTAESRVRAVGWDNAWGENVARGHTSAAQVVREWMASASHRANILNPDYDRIAIELTVAENGMPYWAQNFGNA